MAAFGSTTGGKAERKAKTNVISSPHPTLDDRARDAEEEARGEET